MAGEIGSAYIRIRPQMSGFQAETQSGVKSAFSGIGKIVGAAFAGVAAISFGKEIVQGAAQVQKSVEVIRDDFGAAGEAVIRFNDKSASALGISARAGDETAAKFAVLFKNMGIGQEQAATMTLGMEKLAGSLSSIRGVDPSEVLGKMSLAVAGNTRGLKQLGIVIDNHMIKQEALKLGLISAGAATRTNTIADQELAVAKAKLTEAQSRYGSGTTQVAEAQIAVEKAQAAANKATAGAISVLTPAQKAQAIYALATKDLADFQKQAASHSGDLANQQKRLSAEWSNLKDTLGNALLPAISHVVGKFADWIDAIRQSKSVRDAFNDAVKKTSDVISGLANAFGGTQSAMSQVVQFLGGARVAALAFIAAFSIEKIALFASALRTNLVGAGLKVVQTEYQVTAAEARGAYTSMELGAIGLSATIRSALIATGIGALVVAMGIAVAEIIAHWNTVKKWFVDFANWFKDHWRAIVEYAFGPMGVLAVTIIDHWSGVKKFFVNLADDLKLIFTHPIAAVRKLFFDLVGAIKSIFSAVWNELKRGALEAALGVVEPFSHLPGFLGGWARKAKTAIEGELGQLSGYSASVATIIANNLAAALASAARTRAALQTIGMHPGVRSSEDVAAASAAIRSAGNLPVVKAPPRETGGGPLSVGAGPGAASAAQSLATAKAALAAAFKALGEEAKRLGSDLTAKMREALSALHKEIQDVASKADVTKARENLAELKKEIGDRLAEVKRTIAEAAAFDALKQQVAKLGTDVTPDVKVQMAAIRAEIGHVTTPEQIANLRSQMSAVKREVAAQLTQIKNQIAAEKTQFNSAWSELTSGANAAFDKTTQKALAAMQVMVSASGRSFLFGGDVTQTPAEIALAQLQVAKSAADQAEALRTAQAKLDADQVAEAGVTADQLLADQKAVADARYAIQVSALQTQAQTEREAATKQLGDAQTAYQTQRDLLKAQLDQRVAIIQQGMADGTITAKKGMDDLVGVLGDPAYGIDMQNSGFALGGALYKGLQDGLKPIYDLIDDLTRRMRQVGLLPKTTRPPVTLPGGLVVPAGVIGGGFGGGFPTSVADIADAVAQGTKPIVDAVNDQTNKTTDITVNVDGGVNKTARMALR